jgi:predicted DNA-binding transcriptional regulator AlpA
MSDEVVNFRGIKTLGIPYSRTHIWRLMKDGKFPECFKLGEFRNSPPVWFRDEVVRWIEAKAKGRRSSE